MKKAKRGLDKTEMTTLTVDFILEIQIRRYQEPAEEVMER